MNPKKPLLILLALAAFIIKVPAQVILGIYDPTGTLSSYSVTAGEDFSAPVIVSGLTSANALDSFDLTFALPPGIRITGYTDTVPAGWISFTSATDPNKYGGANFSGDDLTGTNTLVEANFAVAADINAGSYQVTFTPPGDFQDLTDGNEDLIPYTEQDLTLEIAAAPEPATGALIAAAFTLIFALHKWRFLRNRQPRCRALT